MNKNVSVVHAQRWEQLMYHSVVLGYTVTGLFTGHPLDLVNAGLPPLIELNLVALQLEFPHIRGGFSRAEERVCTAYEKALRNHSVQPARMEG